MYICHMRKNKAYLEKIGGEWLDDFVYMSKEPLKRMGFEIIPFDGDDMEHTLTSYPLDIEKDVCFGSVQATNEFFKGCGIEVPEYLGYPEELKPFLGRKIIETTFGKLNQIKIPYFIKPSKGVKKFTGALIEKESQLDFFRDFDNVKDNDPILLSEPMEFISEYRCFVHEGELKGIQFYLGDFKIFPDVEVIEAAIKAYSSSNCAYTLDVGVTKGYCTHLVEVNDMWAIGSYGMDAKDYVLMCVRRMREIGRQANGEVEPLWKKLKQRYE